MNVSVLSKFYRIGSLLLVLLLLTKLAEAGIDPISKYITGPFIVNGNGITLTNSDPKLGMPNINNISVKNAVTLRVNDNVKADYAFTYTLNLQITVYNWSNQATVLPNQSLTVNYSLGHTTYKGIDTYEFTDAYRIDVKVLSEDLHGTVKPPDLMIELGSHIVVNRRYTNFQQSGSLSTTFTQDNTNKTLGISWTPFPGCEEFDIEWTTVNDGNKNFAKLQNISSNSNAYDSNTTKAMLDLAFRNNASRITTASNFYTLSILSTDPLLLVRVRAVQYLSNGLRNYSDWDYRQASTAYNIFQLNWNEPGLNWQYASTYAEEGKKKEVISYFDGSLRNRQTLTINNSDQAVIAQENMYDGYGRVAANILPAPVNQTTPILGYISKLNLNSANNPYSYNDLSSGLGSNCEYIPGQLSTGSGTSRYYSNSNDFLNLNNRLYKKYNQFIPNANGYPLSITQYTADNTGRVKLQGGVGDNFQPGNGTSSSPSKTTKHYYGKPEQIELDRLFGNDVGTADHYMKNMVVDPNGQISVSYLNASGKTIATALAGERPAMVDGLDNYPDPNAITQQSTHLLRAEQFTFDANALKLVAATTYLADIIDHQATLTFNIQKLIDQYPNTSAFSPCSNCYYNMTIQVLDDCGNLVGQTAAPVQIGSAVAACTNVGIQTGSITVDIAKPGEYQVKIEFAYDPAVITAYTDKFISEGIDKHYIQSQFEYIKQRYLDGINASGCYSDCHTCVVALGNRTDFITQVKSKLGLLGLDFSGTNETVLNTWAGGLYDTLKGACDEMRKDGKCSYSTCDDVLQSMLTDVSPGGQYALFTDGGVAIEPNINVLALYQRTVFPVKPASNSDYQAELITRENGLQTSPYSADFSLADLVHYWKPEWAGKFLQYHPEYCKYQFCQLISPYQSWDKILLNDVRKAADLGATLPGAIWDPINNAENWLLNQDTFFNSTYGTNYKNAMLADLQHYSVNVLGRPTSANLPEKGLMAYVDYSLYCANTSGNTNTQQPVPLPNNFNNWANCGVNNANRVPDREWAAYLSLYLSLKQKYYDLAQGVYSPCGTGACTVGPTQTITLGTTSTCPQVQDFTIGALTADAGTASAGMQPVKINHPAGPVNMAVGVGIYYPDASDNTNPNYPHTVQFAVGDQSQTFTLPASIQVGQLVISGIACGGGQVVSGSSGEISGSYLEVSEIQSAPGGIPGCDGVYTSSDYWRAKVVLYDANHIPLQTTNPNGVSITLRYWAQANYSQPNMVYRTITIQPGESTAYSETYLKAAAWDPCLANEDIFNQGISCYTFLSGVSNASVGSGTGLITLIRCVDYTPPPTTPTCPPELAYKTSRFPSISVAPVPANADINTFTGYQNNDLADLQQQFASMAEGTADAWMSALEPGLAALSSPAVTLTQRNTLREALKAITLAGSDSTHLSGASDLNGSGKSQPYINYGAAIKAIIPLPGGKFTMGVNPWMLGSPGPYNVKAQKGLKNVSTTSVDICARLNTLQAAANGQDLYTYLVNTYHEAMTLTQAELNDLLAGCTNRKYLLNSDLILPVFLDPDNEGSKSYSQYTTAKSALSNDFGSNLNTSDPNYNTVLTNYMNQAFGFSLSTDAYLSYDAAASSSVILVNTSGYVPVKANPFNCLNEMLVGAMNSGLPAYAAYIADLRMKFRNDYIATCKLAQPSVDFLAKQQTYHYTLYYYDQADNLVRTVPPEGVHPLAGSALTQVAQNRLYGSGNSCTYDGSLASTNKTAALQSLGAILQNTGTVAIESWLYATGNQPLHLAQVSDDKHWLYQLTISNGMVGIDMYPMTESADHQSVTMNPNSLHYSAAIPSNILPLAPWVHLVIQSPTGITGVNAPQMFINGNPLTVAVGNSLPGNFSIAATANGVTYPDDMSSLKHWRFYTRQLSLSEIQADAQSSCLMPQDFTALTWFRFNIPAAGGPTTVAANSTTETTLQNIYPSHTLKTNYAYNSTNQVTRQLSPDGGNNFYWYDMLSRMVASQNDRQAADASPKTSYTIYDAIGRINQVGEKASGALLYKFPDNTAANADKATGNYLDNTAVNNYLTSGTNAQITSTRYDAPATGSGLASLTQENLRKRVATSYYSATAGTVTNATYYSYDIDGNVKTLWQQINGLNTPYDASTLKRIDYDYDLISGKVNMVKYQEGRPDQFYYAYSYDAENRLLGAYSGTQAMVDSYTNKATLLPWNKNTDATYQYYLHGPLARVELGDEQRKVQGIDYAYTLQGWLKGVNGQTLNTDMGGDGPSLGNIAKDAYAFSLGYYAGDYSPIGGGTSWNTNYAATGSDLSGRSLYNGNISTSTLAISTLNSGAALGFSYGYDQLNRIKTVNRHDNIAASWNFASRVASHHEEFTYDANGNIKTTLRWGNAGSLLDNLTYSYNKDSNNQLTDNRLNKVNDAAADGSFDADMKFGDSPYTYDQIGNLKSDTKSNIGNIDWTVYGKISAVHKTGPTVTDITYTYDAAGNRVSKNNSATSLTTWYVRDPSGNPLAIYDNAGGTVNWKEQQLYGTSRLGMWQPNVTNVTNANNVGTIWQTLGSKQFELNNHLGNVLATITNRRTQTAESSTAYHLEADVNNAQAYYAFGGNMPGLQYTASGASTYRYSFNSKEDDADVDNGAQDYGMRIYDKRLGKFMSVDPLANEYSALTPYQFASNSPIAGNDRDGLEFIESGAYADMRIRDYESQLRKENPKNADAIIRQHNVNAFLFTTTILTMGSGTLATAFGDLVMGAGGVRLGQGIINHNKNQTREGINVMTGAAMGEIGGFVLSKTFEVIPPLIRNSRNLINLTKERVSISFDSRLYSGVPLPKIKITSAVNSAGAVVERNLVSNEDELLQVAEHYLSQMKNVKEMESKPGWYEGLMPDGTRRLIEWQPAGETTTNEGPHVKVVDYVMRNGKPKNVTTAKYFIQGKESLKVKR